MYVVVVDVVDVVHPPPKFLTKILFYQNDSDCVESVEKILPQSVQNFTLF